MGIDFTNAVVNPLKMYGGANGNKIGIVYENENYMLKFPPKPTLNNAMSYSNSCISEHIACKIFNLLGIKTQETLLGNYKDKITVACKDFETDGFILKDFAHLKNTIIDSAQNGYGTDLSDIIKVIQDQNIVSPVELERFFWKMFIGDALLGNFDRHNGNWGFLINNNSGEVKLAPVFDCGSCLYPQINEKQMNFVLNNMEEIEKRIFVFPTSAIQQDGKKINYAQFLFTTNNSECIKALQEIYNRIDLPKIHSLIDNTPYISQIHKLFIKTMINERKEKILGQALSRFLKIESPEIRQKNEPSMDNWKKLIESHQIEKSGSLKPKLLDNYNKEI